MDVFSAFPNAILSGVWQIAGYQRGSLVGAMFDVENAVELDVIVEEDNNTVISSGNNAEPLNADLLLYARPEQLPTTDTGALVSGYLLHDSDYDSYYAIIGASLGRNQETSEVEHVEMLLKQTDVVNTREES